MPLNNSTPNDYTRNDTTKAVIGKVKRCLEKLFDALEPPAKKQMTSVQHNTTDDEADRDADGEVSEEEFMNGAMASISLSDEEN